MQNIVQCTYPKLQKIENIKEKRIIAEYLEMGFILNPIDSDILNSIHFEWCFEADGIRTYQRTTHPHIVQTFPKETVKVIASCKVYTFLNGCVFESVPLTLPLKDLIEGAETSMTSVSYHPK